MFVCENDSVQPADLGAHGLLAEIRCGVDDDYPPVVL
jgi:hypothetical protein